MAQIDVVDQAIIDADPATVYKALLDEVRGSTKWWMPHWQAKLRGGTPVGRVGTIVDITVRHTGTRGFTAKTTEIIENQLLRVEFVEGHFLGQRMEWTSEVTEYEPNRKLKQKIISGPMWMEQSLTFEPVEGATRFTIAGEGVFSGLFKLAQPVVSRRMKKQSQANLAKLKDILEAGA